MKTTTFLLIFVTAFSSIKCQTEMKKDFNKLTQEEEYVILHKGTERPFTGEYDKFFEKGTYVCKRCDAQLYNSDSKFNSGCGWPAFDSEIKDAVNHIPDKDVLRTEIVCANCGAHLGHVFVGEGFTETNTRHCVNSISMKFIPYDKVTESTQNLETAIFAAGCFWGVEHHLKLAKGVVSTEVGYIGGQTKNPTYKDVCYKETGHAEAVKVIYDTSLTNFETLAKLFFEIHDPGQLNRQGPDVGSQYRSEIFYTTTQQMKTAKELIKLLEDKGYKVVTKISPALEFYPAEDYHQDYYGKTNSNPYCHFYQKKF